MTNKLFFSIAKAEKNGKVCGPETKVGGTLAASVEPVGISQTTGKINVIDTPKQAIELACEVGTVTAKLIAFGETSELEQSDNLRSSSDLEVT